MTPQKQRGSISNPPSLQPRPENAACFDGSPLPLPTPLGSDGVTALPPSQTASRSWMVPVTTEPTMAVQDALPLPSFNSSEPQALPAPASTDNILVVGSDFRLQSLPQDMSGFLLAPAAAVGVSLWSVVTPPVRRVLYQSLKRLLGGEAQVLCQAIVPGGDARQYDFECTRQDDNFIIRYTFRAADAMSPATPPRKALPPMPTAPTKVLPSPPSLAPPRTNGFIPALPLSDTAAAGLDVSGDLFQFSPDIICILDGSGNVLQINPSGEQALRFSRFNVPGLPFAELIVPEDHDQVKRTWEQIISASGSTVSLLCRCNGVGGDLRWIQWNFAAVRAASDALPQRVYATGRDVTEHRSREESLHWHLYHDALTGLANRSLLQDRLQYAIALAHRYKHKAAVLFLDLDRLKRVNDTLGHASGDALLKEIANRLSVGMREEDTVARLAGDEFVIVLPRIQDFRDAQLVAEKILARVGQPLMLGNQELFVTASIGISLYPQDGTTADALLRTADTAMYRAKAGGRGRFSIFDSQVSSAPGREVGGSMERLRLENNLSQAIERDELFLHYQPQVSIASGQVVGAEALMRWKSGDGLVPPSTFIPLAEEMGLIVRLGTWAMHEAIVQAGQWRREGHPVQVAVNLSAMQLSDCHFPDLLDTYLQEWQIPASLLDLELTERTFVNAESSMLDVLKRLKTMGVHLSVDDFGTGYGTFSYLRKFPIDGLKVDQSFTAQVDTNPADEAVVRSIIDLAHTLNLNVIAEGVETVGQRDKLQALGCDTMQGYLFSAALSADDLSPMLMFGGKM